MTTPLLTRKRVLLSKIETTYGVDAAATGAANAILCRAINPTPQDSEFASRDLIRQYLGNSEQLPAAVNGKLEVEVELAGSGTAGTAPAWAPLMRACGFSQTLNASAVTGSAQAGGSNTITLAAGASAVDNIYRGLPISITSGTGSGQTQYIIAYNGTTKVATVANNWTTNPAAASGYSILAGCVFAPVSASFESLSHYLNVDGVRHRFYGSRGNVELSLAVKEIPTLKFSFTGLYVPVDDSALPTADYTGFRPPLTANSTNTPVFTLHGIAAGVAPLSALSLNAGNTVVHRPLIGEESVLITDRKSTGQVTIEAQSVATRDWWAIARAATLGTMTLEHGTAAGNICAVVAPAVQITGPTYTDLDGIAMLQANLNLMPASVVGNDDFFLTVR